VRNRTGLLSFSSVPYENSVRRFLRRIAERVYFQTNNWELQSNIKIVMTMVLKQSTLHIKKT